MDSPRQFIYGPPWKFLFCFFVVGIALLALAGVHVISLTVGFGLALLPLAFAFAGTLRRLAFPRFLELGQNGLSFCSGFLQTRVTTIPYEEIEQAWESVRGRMSVLHLRTKDRTFEVVSTLLPDMASYVAVKDFVNSRLMPKASGGGSQTQPREAGKYCFKCSYEGNGEIFASNGGRLWRVAED